MSNRIYTPELAHLQTFLIVCRCGTIGLAAKHLRVSQPAVSAHLKALEIGMKRKLLNRSPRGVEPTPAGEVLRSQIEAHLDGLATLAIAEQTLEGLAVLGGPADLLSMRVLPALRPAYQVGIQVKIQTGITEGLLNRLAAEELDLVIATRWPAGRTDLQFEPLFDEEYVLVGDKTWQQRLAINPVKGLAAATFVAFDEQLPLIRDYPLIREHYAAIFGDNPGQRVAIYAPDLRALREAAIAGIGITVLPRYLTTDALAAKQLYELHSPAVPRRNTIYLATRHGPLHPRLQQIKATLQAAAPSWERPAKA